jgi:hypothetical protein
MLKEGLARIWNLYGGIQARDTNVMELAICNVPDMTLVVSAILKTQKDTGSRC